MSIQSEEINSAAVKLFIEEDGVEVARAFLYLIENGLHDTPYGLLEDVFVHEKHRGKGLGTLLVKEVIKEAKKRKCYKLLGTSRHSREKVHAWYEELGFKNHGLEFRMNF